MDGHIPDLAWLQSTKNVLGYTMILASQVQGLKLIFNAFIGQWKCAPVVSQCVLRTTQFVAANGFIRVLVLIAHEVPGFKSAEGQDGEAKAAIFLAYSPVVDAVVKSGVADMVNLAGRRL